MIIDRIKAKLSRYSPKERDAATEKEGTATDPAGRVSLFGRKAGEAAGRQIRALAARVLVSGEEEPEDSIVRNVENRYYPSWVRAWKGTIRGRAGRRH